MAEPAAPIVVGPRSVLAPAPDTALVDTGDGLAVLYDARHRRAEVLNATAAAVWQALDGITPLADLADRMAHEHAGDSADHDLAARIARDVVALADTLAASDLVVDATDRREPSAPVAGTRRLHLPPSTCFCGADRVAWGPTQGFRVGEVEVGVRTTDLGVDLLVADALRAHVLSDDEVAAGGALDGWFGLDVAAAPVPDDGAPFLTLYAGRDVAYQGRSTAGLWEAFEAHLRALWHERDLLVLDGSLVLGPPGLGGAALGARVVPPLLGEQIDVRAAIATRGATAAPGPVVLDGAEVVLEPLPTLDRTAVDRFVALVGDGRPRGWPDRLALDAWVTWDDLDAGDGPGGRSGLLARVLPAVANAATLGAAEAAHRAWRAVEAHPHAVGRAALVGAATNG